MLIYLGADHRGFRHKERIKSLLKDEGYEVVDKGAASYNEDDDYPDFASAVAKEVAKDTGSRRGIVICGSGVGVDVVANKFPGIRSALVALPDQVNAARHDEDANVLSLAANFTTEEDAIKIVKVFLATPFGGAERYKRRIGKISEIEENKI